MNDDIKLALMICVYGTIIMAAWTILAMSFGKWWIALFAILFMPSIKHYGDEKEKEKEE